MIFDSRLTDCGRQAGILIIYTFNQTDSRSRNGFRIALPCHPELRRQTGIPRHRNHRPKRHPLRLFQQHHPRRARLPRRPLHPRIHPRPHHNNHDNDHHHDYHHNHHYYHNHYCAAPSRQPLRTPSHHHAATTR